MRYCWQAGDDSRYEETVDCAMQQADAEDARIVSLSFDEWASEARRDGPGVGFPPEETEQLISERARAGRGGLSVVEDRELRWGGGTQ